MVRRAVDADDDDMSLIRAYRNGDVHAFETFFSRYRDRIRNLCLRYLPEEAAEDTVQDTFLQFVRTIDRIDESYRVSSWIQRIAVNLCHDELRRRGRRKRLFEPASDVTELAMMAVADSTAPASRESAAGAPAHPRAGLGRRRHAAAAAAHRARPARAARTPYHVIADRLGTSTSAVETLLHRARERFKTEFLRLEGAQPGIAACRTAAPADGGPGRDAPASAAPGHHPPRRLRALPARYGAAVDPQIPERLAS